LEFSFLVLNVGGDQIGHLSCFQRSADLYDPQQVQDDEDDGNNEQGMDPTACLRETWAYASTEIAEKPQNYQNYNDSPHKISPFE